MAENPVVAFPSPAPAASAPASPAPDAPAAAPQVDVVEEIPTVNIADIVSEKKVDKEGSDTPKPTDKPAVKPVEKAPKPTTQEPAKDKTPPKSQSEINHGLGERLRAERAKYAPYVRMVEVLRDMNPGLSDEQLMKKLESDRDEAFGNEPAKAIEALKARGAFGGRSKEQSDEGAPQGSDEGPDVDTDEWTDAQADEASKIVGAQAEEIHAMDPDFDMEKFLAELGGQKLRQVATGKVTLKDFYLQREGAAALKRIHEAGIKLGGKQTAENIKNRNDNVPGPISPSAPPIPTLDFANMSDEEFARVQDRVHKAQRGGARVVFGRG